MKKFIKIIAIIILLLAQTGWSQLENANWYFGNHAGLNFEGSTTVLTDGQTNNEYGNSASVSDSNGNLLFYTNGNTVWNKNHLIMQNGNNTLLHTSGIPIIVPFPNDINRYYIFHSWGLQTVQADSCNRSISGSTNFGYSIINVDTNIGNGLGFVETLNVDLNTLPYYDTDENIIKTYAQKMHMAVTKHSDGESFWLIINPFDKFFVYKIDSSGVSSNPVISDSSGNYFQGNYLQGVSSGSASMSISPDGSKIAFTNNSSTPCSDAGGVSLNIYNFDNSNGNITYFYNEFFWEFLYKASSVEFSNNNKYLYVAGFGNNDFDLLQYDMDNITTNPIAIFGDSNTNIDYGYSANMRRAIDGKIYIPGLGNNKLSVINNPNNVGVACNFVDNQINLGSNTVKLPYLVPSYELGCVLDLTITQSVNISQIDIQESSNTITATNIIFSDATAEYDAGQTVFLKPGFHAQNGSNFRAYIEGCNIDIKPQKGGKKQIINTKRNSNNFVKIYPNPTTNKIAIKSLTNFKSWKLTNSFGNIKRESDLSNVNKDTINLSDLPTGIYYLNVIYKDGKIITKTIVKK